MGFEPESTDSECNAITHCAIFSPMLTSNKFYASLCYSFMSLFMTTKESGHEDFLDFGENGLVA